MHSKLLSTGNQLVKSSNSANLALVRSNDQSKFEFKMWHLAVLVGVPSATFLTYYLFKKLTAKPTTRSSSIPKKDKTEPVVEPVKKETKPKTPIDIAVEKKNQGNEFFQAGKFDKAVECYSEAIQNCPQNDKYELPKFYQNRAAAYENLVILKLIIFEYLF